MTCCNTKLTDKLTGVSDPHMICLWNSRLHIGTTPLAVSLLQKGRSLDSGIKNYLSPSGQNHKTKKEHTISRMKKRDKLKLRSSKLLSQSSAIDTTLYAPSKLSSIKKFILASQLNGNAGEFTNGDDMPPKRRQSVPQKKKKGSPKGKKNTPSTRQTDLVRALFQAPARPQPRRPHLSTNSASVRLSKCAMRLALAIADPFAVEARGACGVMGYSTGLTQKVHCITRGIFSTGANSNGWLLIQPSLAHNGPVAYGTTSGFAGAQMNPLSANNTLTGGVTRIYPANLPYSIADLTGVAAETARVTGRVISMGVRICYIGSTMNLAGNQTCFTSSAHLNPSIVPGTTTAGDSATLQTNAEAEISPCSREWCTLSMFPTTPYEASFSNYQAVQNASSSVYPYSNGASVMAGGFTDTLSGVTVGIPIGVIYVYGTNGFQSFQYEIIQHIEYSGPVPTQFGTPSFTDEQGGHLVLSASQQLLPLKAESPPNTPLWPLMRRALGVAAKGALEFAVPVATAALSSLLV